MGTAWCQRLDLAQLCIHCNVILADWVSSSGTSVHLVVTKLRNLPFISRAWVLLGCVDEKLTLQIPPANITIHLHRLNERSSTVPEPYLTYTQLEKKATKNPHQGDFLFEPMSGIEGQVSKLVNSLRTSLLTGAVHFLDIFILQISQEVLRKSSDSSSPGLTCGKATSFRLFDSDESKAVCFLHCPK